jgi:mono/diheme cytochrome c family protein
MGKTLRTVAMVSAVLAMAFATSHAVRADDLVDEGRTVFDGRCKVCHKIERIVQISQRNPGADHQAKWTKFLPSHGGGLDAAGREAVLAYLVSVVPKP